MPDYLLFTRRDASLVRGPTAPGYALDPIRVKGGTLALPSRVLSDTRHSSKAAEIAKGMAVAEVEWARDVSEMFDTWKRAAPRDFYHGVGRGDASIDTAAIQAALDWQAAEQTTFAVVSALGGARGTAPTVDLMDGVYSLAEPLAIKSRHAEIVGRGAFLKPAEGFSGAGAIVADGSGWRVNIEGLQFQDFPTALYLNSSNVNSGIVNIRDCAFFHCTERAIYLECQSSITTIADCLFRDNKRELYAAKGDIVRMAGGWISRGVLDEDYDGGIVLADGDIVFTMDGVLGVPTTQTVTEPCWVKSYGSLVATHCRFGAEAGSHAVCNNFAAADLSYPIKPRRVDITHCDVNCANGDRTAVRLFDLPNAVRIKDNYGFPDQRYIAWSSTLDSGEQDSIIAAKLAAASTAASDKYIMVDVSGNVTQKMFAQTSQGGPFIPTNLADFTV